jgi:hypothetical protein
MRLLRRAATTLSCTALLLIVWTALAMHVAGESRDDRLRQRSPVMASFAEPGRQVGWYKEGSDIIHDQQFSVVGLVPLDDSASPPPGLPRWPRPAEAFLSPALIASDQSEQLRLRYGDFAGPIGQEGIADPNELFVYYRPPSGPELNLERWEPIFGFGQSPAYPWISQSRSPNPNHTTLATLLLLLTGGPTLLLASVAAFCRPNRRETIGRSRRLSNIALSTIRDTLIPAVLGTGVAVIMVLLTALDGFTFPLVGYQVAAYDITASRVVLAPAAIATIVMTTVLSIAANLILHNQNRQREASRGVAARYVKRVFAATWPRWVAATGFGVCVLAALGGSGNRAMFTLGLIITVVVLPLLTLRLSRDLGSRIAVYGERRSSESALFAGRWIRERPWPVAGTGTVLAIALISITQLQVYLTVTDGPFGNSLRLREEVGVKVVLVSGENLDANLKHFAKAIGSDQLLRVFAPGEQERSPLSAKRAPRIVINGTCAALARIGKMHDCPTAAEPPGSVYTEYEPLGNALNAIGMLGSTPTGTAEVKVSSTEGGDRLVSVIVYNTNGQAGYDAIIRVAYATLPVPSVVLPGQEWMTAISELAVKKLWILVIGLAGFALLTMAGSVAVASGFLKYVRASDRPHHGAHQVGRSRYSAAAWAILVPLSMAAVVAAAAALAYGTLLRGMEGSGTFSVGVLGVSVIYGAFIAFVCFMVSAPLLRSTAS